MAYIFVDKSGEGDGAMRREMRQNMRGGNYYRSPMMRGGSYEHGYRMGYKNGWEDSEHEDDMDYRRGRDSRGRFV